MPYNLVWDATSYQRQIQRALEIIVDPPMFRPFWATDTYIRDWCLAQAVFTAP